MTVTVYQYTEAPLPIEEVVDIEVEDGGDAVTIVSATEGRFPFNMDDIMKFEVTNGRH